MTNWLHCNTCYRVLQDRCLFFMTSCGHIFCEKCEQKGWKQKCPLCSTVTPTVIPLTNPVPACVQLFVGDPVTMLRKNPSSARQVAATLEWQNSHMKRYLNHLSCKIRYYEGYVANLKDQFKKHLSMMEKDKRCRMEEFHNTAVARLEKQRDDFQDTLEALKKEAQQRLDQQRKNFESYSREYQNRLEQQKANYQENVSTLEKEYVKIRDENRYLKRLLGQKSSPARMSPSGDRGKHSSSPTMKGIPSSSPNNSIHSSGICHQEKHHSHYSCHGSGYKGSPSSVRQHYQVSPDTTTAHNKVSSSNQTHIKVSPSSNIICGKVVSKTPPSDCCYATPTVVSKQNVPSIDERLQKLQRNTSPQRALHSSYQENLIKTPLSAITSGRVSMRTPPSGGRLGSILPVAIPSLSTPSPQFRPKTPKSMPHPMNFGS